MREKKSRHCRLRLAVDNVGSRGQDMDDGDQFLRLAGQFATLKKKTDSLDEEIFRLLAMEEPKVKTLRDWPEDVAADDPAASDVFEPMDTAPLKLEQAICLPELGGVLLRSSERSTPSPSFTIKTLRGAIDRGELAVIRPNSKNLFVSKQAIQEWLSSCHGAKSTPAPSSASVKHATTRMESSPIAEPSSSTTTESKLRQDAVSAMLLSMQKRTKRQS